MLYEVITDAAGQDRLHRSGDRRPDLRARPFRTLARLGAHRARAPLPEVRLLALAAQKRPDLLVDDALGDRAGKAQKHLARNNFV